MTSPPSLVVFDLGNVLVRIARDWAHAFELAGVGPPKTPASEQAAALRELVFRADRGQADIVTFCREAAKLMDLNEADVRRVSDAYLLGHFPGVQNLLMDLRTAGVRTACLSNTNDNHWRLLSSAPYRLDLLDFRVASHQVGEKKPDAAIYAHLERLTGARGTEILFFDDLPENVAAAVARGWRGELVAPADNPVPFLRSRLVAHGVLPG
jgi:HAD superfamily hydrolase (TIGR01509 family)